jgi:hypothetical protein
MEQAIESRLNLALETARWSIELGKRSNEASGFPQIIKQNNCMTYNERTNKTVFVSGFAQAVPRTRS